MMSKRGQRWEILVFAGIAALAVPVLLTIFVRPWMVMFFFFNPLIPLVYWWANIWPALRNPFA